MSSILTDHFRLIDAHHTLFLIDSCSSGLAIDGIKMLGDDTDGGLSRELSEMQRSFAGRLVIESEIKHSGKNIFVASTGDEDALWKNGGVFTRSLIDNLDGSSGKVPADLDGNGVVQLDELVMKVTNEVNLFTRASGFHQFPSFFHQPGLFGRGRMAFVYEPIK